MKRVHYILVLAVLSVLMSCSKDISSSNFSSLALQSRMSLNLSRHAGTFEIRANCSDGFEAVHAQLTDSTCNWLELGEITAGKNPGDAVMQVRYFMNPLKEGRETAIQLFADHVREPLTVKVSQVGISRIFVETNENNEVMVSPDGGEVTIPIKANVKFKAKVLYDKVDDWADIREVTDTSIVLALDFMSKQKSSWRRAHIYLEEVDGFDDMEPTICHFCIVQSRVVVKYAAAMKHARLFPKWEHLGRGTVVTPGTIECLVRYDYDKPNSDCAIFGSYYDHYLYVGAETADIGPGSVVVARTWSEFSTFNPFFPGHWYHVALTVSPSEGTTVYINGVRVFNENDALPNEFEFNRYEFDPLEDNGSCFWFGYIGNADNYFPGVMTEMRIWSRALSNKEILEENHFFDVDPASYGLLYYWKMTEGEGDVIKNKSLYNPVDEKLYGARLVEDRADPGIPGIEWVTVNLTADDFE